MSTRFAPRRRHLCAAASLATLTAPFALPAAFTLLFAPPVAAQQPAAAPPLQLITPAEAQREREMLAKAEPEARSRSTARAGAAAAAKSGLAIRVVAPSTAGPVAAPLRIELAFDAPAGTKAVPSTFRVLYGMLKLDLTERLRRVATITESGVVVPNVAVPDGLHRLFLSVADEQGNVAEHELRVRVGAP
jgi:hypothetical protein